MPIPPRPRRGRDASVFALGRVRGSTNTTARGPGCRCGGVPRGHAHAGRHGRAADHMEPQAGRNQPARLTTIPTSEPAATWAGVWWESLTRDQHTSARPAAAAWAPTTSPAPAVKKTKAATAAWMEILPSQRDQTRHQETRQDEQYLSHHGRGRSGPGQQAEANHDENQTEQQQRPALLAAGHMEVTHATLPARPEQGQPGLTRGEEQRKRGVPPPDSGHPQRQTQEQETDEQGRRRKVTDQASEPFHP